jgi:preprotein translocase subunit SecG
MEEEETKPTLESRVIVGLVVIFIVIVVVLVTKTIYDKQHEENKNTPNIDNEYIISKQ